MSLPGGFGDSLAEDRKPLEAVPLGRGRDDNHGSRASSPTNTDFQDAKPPNSAGSGLDSSAANTLQRPPLPLRTMSHSAAMPESAAMTVPSSPALSDARFDSDPVRAEGEPRPDDHRSASGSRRADMDRIKSRAVDTASWNWEAEKARAEAALAARSANSTGTPNPDKADHRLSTAVPVAPPRNSSRAVLPPTRPRVDTGHSSPRVGSDDVSYNRPATPKDSGGTLSQRPSQPNLGREKPPVPTTTTTSRREQLCDACGKPMTGQFVRALGVVFHLDCFRCRDCNKVVASKFFPATDDMREKDSSSPRSSSGGEEEKRPQKLFPLCETDYFRRLDLLCAKCGGALRGSYITALGSKFHVEHFTCSVCPTVFGPQDSYYEHDGKVFCHFHYSTRFAIRCTGCRTAILKQFVEINRNNQDEHWHPECYMIHKFWNIKLCPTGQTPKDTGFDQTTALSTPQPSNHGIAPVNDASATDEPSAEALDTEATETPSSLKQKQKTMEERVYRIWTVLSAFEESSAACISEMLRHVSSGRYLGGVRMAERFILHVEVLFSAIDDIERQFRKEQTKGISHIREARMLCKKIVNFFSLLSHTQETGARRMGITQELLSLVTGLAHYLKILIRITLTGALKLGRDHDNQEAITRFLDQLAYLAAVTGEDKHAHTYADSNGVDPLPMSEITMQGRDGRWYGYRSLPRSTSANSSDGNEGATDLCVSCGQTVEEECVRMGINMRWHASCLRCGVCKRRAQKESSSSRKASDGSAEEQVQTLPASEFALEITSRPFSGEGAGSASTGRKLYHTYCAEHAPTACRRGFETGTRLEQYAFLLRVALNRLYALLKKRGVVPASPPLPAASSELPSSNSTTTIQATQPTDAQDGAYQDPTDIKRMKSVNLDRKLSTKAKVPRISTVIGSPSGQQTLAASVQQRTSPTSAESSPKAPSSKENEQHGTSRSRSPGRLLRRSPSPGDVSRGPDRFLTAQSREASPAREPGSVFPVRPAFARHNTDVRIREDGPRRQPSADEQVDPLQHAEDGLTLGDIPQLLEAEQAREQRRSLYHDGGRSLSELSALELFIVKHMAVMMLQQSPLRDLVPMDDLIDFIEMRKNTFWGKLFKSGKDKKRNVEKKGVFGIPLEILVEKSGADSTLGASTTHLRVPSFIDEIISAMKQMDVSVEGIFRKNGNIRRLKELSEALDRDTSSVNLLDDNPVQLAALLKKFLRELPDPLLTFKLHKLFVMSQKLDEPERLRTLHLVTLLLPKAHRDTLEVLFVFLKWVASFSHVDEETGSKMDLQNLAMVLGPNILYAKGQDPAKDELFLANRAILCLLENQEEFWMVPEDLEAVLQDRELLSASSELTSRDILKRCEKYAKRARHQGGSGASGSSAERGRGGYGGPGRGGKGEYGTEMLSGSRQQRPEYHDPVTMRQIEGGGWPQQYSNGAGPGSGAMMRTGSSQPFSPVDRPGGSDRPPWANGGGGMPAGNVNRQHHGQGGTSSAQHTPYGSPERSQQPYGGWGSMSQQPQSQPNGGSSGGAGQGAALAAFANGAKAGQGAGLRPRGATDDSMGSSLSPTSSNHGLQWQHPSRQQSA
ncbi:unnamed protein product [Parajaminaea phylloscopi]